MIEMSDADSIEEFVMGSEFLDGEQKGCRVGASGNSDDDRLTGRREPELAPLNEQQPSKLIDSHCSDYKSRPQITQIIYLEICVICGWIGRHEPATIY